ncbi:MAG: PD40 domain-containing protein [Bacteroidales bacterium]|nr:PD40 domain-containing protein [Bacteroidales bacterium]
MTKYVFIAAALFLILACNRHTGYEYFGQTPPGDTPEIFAPGIISLDNRNESMITFSPDGKQCYFTVSEKPWNDVRIMESVYKKSVWTTPEIAPFISNYAMCPSISSDGTKLFFISSYKGASAGVNQCQRTANGDWSAPAEMDSLINSGFNEYSCHLSSRGTMYVCSWRSGGAGGCDGWRIPSVDGQFQKAENLGALNSKVGDCLWAPGPDEEYLIFQSRRPPTGNAGGFFETDLFITFALPGGEWSAPQNLGSEINSDSTDGFAWISHDGEYLFFSSNRSGSYDIYWVRLDSVLKNTPKIPLTAEIQEPDDYVFYQKFDFKTSLHFDLKKPGYTKLTIYNLAGEKINTILDEYRLAGENEFVWEGDGYRKGKYICALQLSEEKAGKPYLETAIQVLLR